MSMLLDRLGVSEVTSNPRVASAGARPQPGVDYRCTECGYGVVVFGAPPPCPMCRHTAWLRLEPRGSRDVVECR
jgi:rubrerythrin